MKMIQIATKFQDTAPAALPQLGRGTAATLGSVEGGGRFAEMLQGRNPARLEASTQADSKGAAQADSKRAAQTDSKGAAQADSKGAARVDPKGAAQVDPKGAAQQSPTFRPVGILRQQNSFGAPASAAGGGKQDPQQAVAADTAWSKADAAGATPDPQSASAAQVAGSQAELAANQGPSRRAFQSLNQFVAIDARTPQQTAGESAGKNGVVPDTAQGTDRMKMLSEFQRISLAADAREGTASFDAQQGRSISVATAAEAKKVSTPAGKAKGSDREAGRLSARKSLAAEAQESAPLTAAAQQAVPGIALATAKDAGVFQVAAHNVPGPTEPVGLALAVPAQHANREVTEQPAVAQSEEATPMGVKPTPATGAATLLQGLQPEPSGSKEAVSQEAVSRAAVVPDAAAIETPGKKTAAKEAVSDRSAATVTSAASPVSNEGGALLAKGPGSAQGNPASKPVAAAPRESAQVGAGQGQNGAGLQVKLSPAALKGENGVVPQVKPSPASPRVEAERVEVVQKGSMDSAALDKLRAASTQAAPDNLQKADSQGEAVRPVTTAAPEKEQQVTAAPAKEQPVAAASAKEQPVAAAPVKEQPVAAAPAKEQPVAAAPVKEQPVAAAPDKGQQVAAASDGKLPGPALPGLNGTSGQQEQVTVEAAPADAAPLPDRSAQGAADSMGPPRAAMGFHGTYAAGRGVAEQTGTKSEAPVEEPASKTAATIGAAKFVPFQGSAGQDDSGAAGKKGNPEQKAQAGAGAPVQPQGIGMPATAGSEAPPPEAKPVNLKSALHESILAQIKDGVVTHDDKGNGQISIRLNPGELGELKIQVRMDDNRLRVEVQADNKMVKDLLMSNLDSLKDSLTSKHFTMEGFDVSTGGGGFNSPLPEQKGSPRQQSQLRSARAGAYPDQGESTRVSYLTGEVNNLLDVRF
jgi:flagellar hook-length control protein FliK